MRGVIIRIVIPLVGIAIWLSAGAVIEDVSTRKIVMEALRDALVLILIGLWGTFLVFHSFKTKRTECNRFNVRSYYEIAATAYAIAGLMLLCYPIINDGIHSPEPVLRGAVCNFTLVSAAVVSLVAMSRIILSGTRMHKGIGLVGAVLPVCFIYAFMYEYTVWLPAFVNKH